MAYKPFIKNTNDELVELPLYADTADKLGTKTVGGTNNPVYLSSGAPKQCERTIPKITLNGSTNTAPSFYAPTSSGTKGYFLVSNGSGSPSWVKNKTETVLWSGVESLFIDSSDSRPQTKTFTISKELVTSLSDEIYMVLYGAKSLQRVPVYLTATGDTKEMNAEFDEFRLNGSSYRWVHGEVCISGSGSSYTATIKCDARLLTLNSTVTSSKSVQGGMTLLKIIKVS